MKVTEITLGSDAYSLEFKGKLLATVDLWQAPEPPPALRIHFKQGAELELANGVDVSEQMSSPRTFVIEGSPSSAFVVFGGEKVYWVADEGRILREVSLFRRFSDAEYWTTEIIAAVSRIVIVYEAGVLAIDDNLELRWHRKKFFNDVFVALDGNSLRFVRDHDTPWSIQVDDGTDSS